MAKYRSPVEFNELREKAEKLIAEKKGKLGCASLKNDIQELSHELSVYHIELEMQNDELRRSQEDLEESRSRYFDLYENAPVGYLTLDEKGVVIDMNLTATHLLRIDRTFLLKKPFAALIASESQDAFYLHRRQVLVSPGTHSCELMLRRDKGQGQFFHVQLESIAASAGAATVLRVVLTDITARKRAEEDLLTSRLQLAEAADLARIAYWERDDATGEFIFNDAFYEIYGTTNEREGGYRMSREEYAKRFVHPDDREELRRQVDRNRAQPRTDDIEQYEHRGISRNGGVIHVLNRNRAVLDPQGRILKVVGVNQDITARKEMVEALRESEERYRIAMESSPEGVALMKGKDAFYVNQNLADMFGYERPEEFLKAGFEHAVHPEDQRALSECMRTPQWDAPLPSRYEFRGIKKDGTTILVEALVARIISQGENVSLAYLRDITEAKRLEDELLHSHKIAAIGQLAGGMAHDFNNILSVITCFSELLRIDMKKDDPSLAYLDQIAASSQKAVDLVRNLTTLSRKEVFKPEACDVNDVVERVGKVLRRLLMEDIELRLKLAPEDLRTKVDVAQIDQVLMNLAANAKDAMPEGGLMIIETGTVAIDQTFVDAQGYGDPGKYALVSVSDSGIGMDETTQARVFEPFFTTKDAGKGTGLGLSMAYDIVRQNGGYITVSSRPGQGTMFSICLPLLDADLRPDLPSENKIASRV